jgi:hypothetical protein
MGAAIGEVNSDTLAQLLHPRGTFIETRHALGQARRQCIEEVGTVNGRLTYTFGHTGAQVPCVFAAAPFEPDILPRCWRSVSDELVGFGQAKPFDSPYGIGTKGDTRAYLAERRSGFEELNIKMGMTAQIQCQGDAGNTTTNDTDL